MSDRSTAKPRSFYVDRIAAIGWTEAARRAGATPASTAVRIAIAAPAT